MLLMAKLWRVKVIFTEDSATEFNVLAPTVDMAAAMAEEWTEERGEVAGVTLVGDGVVINV